MTLFAQTRVKLKTSNAEICVFEEDLQMEYAFQAQILLYVVVVMKVSELLSCGTKFLLMCQIRAGILL